MSNKDTDLPVQPAGPFVHEIPHIRPKVANCNTGRNDDHSQKIYALSNDGNIINTCHKIIVTNGCDGSSNSRPISEVQ
jgi:hypothetical protein